MVKKVQPGSALHHGSAASQDQRIVIGLILECVRDGPDQKVCEHLIGRLQPGIKVESVTLREKRNLIAQCGNAAATLLKQGCECVIIIWDLYPAWGVHGAKPCLSNDRKSIHESLAAAGVTSSKASKVHLVCIHNMLEAWLLADERAISAVLSKIARGTVSIARVKKPESEKKPKKLLSRIFSACRRQYQSHIHAEMIVREMRDFDRLERCKSFAYFLLKLNQCAPLRKRKKLSDSQQHLRTGSRH